MSPATGGRACRCRSIRVTRQAARTRPQCQRQELVQAEAMSRYNAPDASLDPETVAAVVAWLRARA